MDALIRFSETGGFQDFYDVMDYFEEVEDERNGYFNNSSKINQIEKDDILYFSFKGKIVLLHNLQENINMIGIMDISPMLIKLKISNF